MSCNQNNISLDVLNNSSCNGCDIKPINVICRKILVPSGQSAIGIKGENNSNIRIFLIPKIDENGVDISDKKFTIITKNNIGEVNIIEVDNIEIVGNYVKITWNITDNIISNEGLLYVQIQVQNQDNTEYVWKSHIAKFFVENSL